MFLVYLIIYSSDKKKRKQALKAGLPQIEFGKIGDFPKDVQKDISKHLILHKKFNI
jgi:hypothetical protein